MAKRFFGLHDDVKLVELNLIATQSFNLVPDYPERGGCLEIAVKQQIYVRPNKQNLIKELGTPRGKITMILQKINTSSPGE